MPPPAVPVGLQYNYIHVGAWASSGHHHVAFGFLSAFFFHCCCCRRRLERVCVILPGLWIIVNAKTRLDCTVAGTRPNLKKMLVFGFSHSILVDPFPFTQIPFTSLLQFKVVLK